MAYRFAVGESVCSEVRRIAGEQLEAAQKDLNKATSRTADAAVHAARKRLKKIRALVRLVRDPLGAEAYGLENACFRDAGGSLSEARDAAVLVETLDALKPQVDEGIFAATRKRLIARRKAVRLRSLRQENGLEKVSQTLQEARGRVAHWEMRTDGWEALEGGLQRSYGDGRAAWKRADLEAESELFHEWRKRVKDLWHHLELIESVWPSMLTPLADGAHSLADLLGDEHDLSVLRSVLEAEALAKAEPLSAVVVAIDEARAVLRTQARSLGDRIYAEKSKAFLHRIKRYWHTWQHPETPAESPAIPIPDGSSLDGGGTETGGGSTSGDVSSGPQGDQGVSHDAHTDSSVPAA